MTSAFWSRVVVAFMVCACSASRLSAQTPSEDSEHHVVYEFGWASEWNHEEGFHHGGTAAVEFTPIEHWLEMEIGVSAIHAAGGSEIPVDVIVKKPWTISRKFEFMAGIGPELIRATGPAPTTYWGVSAVLDFMVWPMKNVGWYVEPGYERTFQHDGSRDGLAVAAGLLLGR